MGKLTMMGLLVASLVAGGVLLEGQRAGAQPIPGATYTGTHSGGGTIEFTLSPDGASVTALKVSGGSLPRVCGVTSVFVKEGESVPMVAHSFTVRFGSLGARLGADGLVEVLQNTITGSFPAMGTAQGTIFCFTTPGIFGRSSGAEGGLMTWSAAVPGAPLPVPPLPKPVLTVLQQECSTVKPETVVLTFSWRPLVQGSQWLDLSLVDNGFAPGTFVGVGPLLPDSSIFHWDGLRPGTVHYVRVNTSTPTGWLGSETLALTTVVCGGPAALGQASQACGSQPGTVDVTFKWNPSAPQGSVQWLDLSLLNNGFAPGTFVSAAPLAPAAASFTWRGLRSGLTHYWRVNTLAPTGWRPSSTASFVTGSCG